MDMGLGKPSETLPHHHPHSHYDFEKITIRLNLEVPRCIVSRLYLNEIDGRGRSQVEQEETQIAKRFRMKTRTRYQTEMIIASPLVLPRAALITRHCNQEEPVLGFF